jgi:hypothetical protein
MAQIDYVEDGYGGYDHYGRAENALGREEQLSERSRFGALVNWAGALMSLGLIVGMAIWAVQLTLRDVSGVPVIEALEGPMREAPADPGGTQAPNQGFAVNRIAEGEEAQPVPDRLVLAPPPIELREVRFEVAAEPEVEAEAGAGSLPGADVAPDTPRTASREETEALIDRLLQEAQPGLAVPETEASAGPEVAVALAASDDAYEVLPVSVPGIARSLRPTARPVAFVTQTGTDGGTATEEIAASDLPDGTRLVQLGAFDTADLAREEWARIAGQFPDYFEDRPLVIEEAESGGQTFFRLRAAGFDDLAGSRRFCAVLVAQGTACIPVTVR